jgi:hypothetical protein
MLCVEGQISSCSTNIQQLNKFGSCAGYYQFFASEDLIARKKCNTGNKTFTYIDGDEMDFGVTVLPSFRGGHVHDLAGSA